MHLSCTICSELYQSTDATGVIDCGHLFHIDCVTPWINSHHTCPQCRASCATTNLKRIFFSEVSDEEVHLNRNCDIPRLQALIDSHQEEVIDLTNKWEQTKSDLDELGRHIHLHLDEINELKDINSFLGEENRKLTTELKREKEDQFPFLIPVDSENAKQNEMDIIELKTIIASYEMANELVTSENSHLQRQLDAVVSRCELLEEENRQIKESNAERSLANDQKSEPNTLAETIRKTIDSFNSRRAVLENLKTSQSKENQNSHTFPRKLLPPKPPTRIASLLDACGGAPPRPPAKLPKPVNFEKPVLPRRNNNDIPPRPTAPPPPIPAERNTTKPDIVPPQPANEESELVNKTTHLDFVESL